MRNRRAIVCAALALAVPLPAFALTSGGEDAGPASLSVSASLGSCGIAQTQVVCVIDVSFEPFPGARRYRASVTRADGSVIDYGSIDAGGASLPVTYVGAGTYGVRVSAYGHKDESDKPVLLDTDSSHAKPGDDDADPAGEQRRKRKTDAYGPAGQAEPAAPQEVADAGASGQPADCVAEPVDPQSTEPAVEPPATDPAVEEDEDTEDLEDSRRRDRSEEAADEDDETLDAPTVAPPGVDPTCPVPSDR